MKPTHDVDRGYAWVVLFASFCAMFICGMMVYSTGVINTAILEEVDSDLSRTSWVGSTMLGTFTFMGPLAGLITKKLGYRLACFGGRSTHPNGTRCSILWFGVGLGLNSSGVAPGHYFVKKRSLAFGVTVSGAGMGMFTGGPLSQMLIQEYSLSGCLLILGAIASNMCVAACLLRPVPSTRKKMTDDTNHQAGTCISETSFEHTAISREECSVDSVEFMSAVEPLVTDNCSGGTAQHSMNHQENHIKSKHKGNTLEGKFLPLTSTDDEECFIGASNNSGKMTKDNNTHCSSCYEKGSPNPFRNCLKRIRRITILNKYGFISYCLSFLFWALGEGACLFHLPNYAEHKGSTETEAASLFTVMGVGSVISRLLTGFAGSDASVDYVTLHMGLLGISGLLTLCFPLYSNSYVLQMTFSAAYGLYSGGLNTLISPITIELMGLKHLAIGSGIGNFFRGIGFFAGPPLSSFIYSATRRYDFTFVFAGTILLLGAFFGALVGIFGKQSQQMQNIHKSEEVQEAIEESPK
ncbi:monocarboxylate transporter 14-like [Haliotis rubra]|uniref:monocarboxylate transporter 14-like n=1 Tax=Haliotis rubra TaxID=36100 RepID=UPI001EE5BDC7|nr:monocarboxylate transporter 14-like [Haliotis rubra]